MLALKSVKFKEDFRCFKKGDIIKFLDGVTLLVGEQGCGKSTLLDLLSNNRGNRKTYLTSTLSEEVQTNAVKTLFFDCEKHNPRIRQESEEMNFELKIALMFRSHGEAILPIITHLEKLKEPTCIFIDEPDMAMSIRSIEKIKELFKKLAKDGHQLIVSAHNPFLILGFKKVYSLEHRKFMSSKDFIESHLDMSIEKYLK